MSIIWTRPRRPQGTRAAALVLGAALAWWPWPVAAQEPGIGGDPASRARYPSEGQAGQAFESVAGELRCPTCTGLSVLDSDAQFSVQIKDVVKEQLEAGKSKDEILAYFTERYGPWILRSPPAKGFNLLAWVLPTLLLLCGPVAIWLLVWRQRRTTVNLGVRAPEALMAEMDARLAALRAARRQGGAG